MANLSALEEIQEIAALAGASVEVLAARWLPDAKKQGNDLVAPNPTRSDANAGSFRVCALTGKFNDFATGDSGGDLVALRAYLDNSTQKEAAKVVADELGFSGYRLQGQQPRQRTTNELANIQGRIQAHKQAIAEREQQEAQARANAASEARQIWADCKPTESHPYLAAKGVISHGLKVDVKGLIGLHNQCKNRNGRGFNTEGWLVIPAYDAEQNLSTLQAIAPDGKRAFLTGGAVNGASFTIDGNEPAILTEGYATAATVHQLTGQKVIAAFSATNLKNLAPLAQLNAADNDSEKTNTGLKVAEQLAAEFNLPYTLPPKAGDWNDYTQEHGLEEARQAFNAGKTQPLAKQKLAPAEPASRFDFGSLINSDYEHLELPESVLNTEIGKLATEVQKLLEMPLATVFFGLLGGASVAASTNYCGQFTTSKTRVSLGLYIILEQPPSTQKSRLLGIALGDYKARITEHNKRIYIENEKLGEETLPEAFNVTSDPTTAALDQFLTSVDSGRYVVATDEQSALDSLFPNGTHASNNALLLNGWVGENYSGMRIGRRSFSGEVRGSVLLIAQRGSSERIFKESNNTGLAERFLFISEPSNLGSRKHTATSLDWGADEAFKRATHICLDRFTKRVSINKAAFSETKNAQEEKQAYKPDPEHLNINTQLEDLELIKPSLECQEEIRKIKISLEPFLAELEQNGELTYLGWLGKVETHALKLATTLYIYDQLGANGEVKPELPVEYLTMALELVINVGHHIRQLIKDSGETGLAAELEAVIKAVTEKPLDRTALTMKLKNRAPFKRLGKASYSHAKKSVEEAEQKKLIMFCPDKSGLVVTG